jgi:hypothetical protein
VAKKRKHPGAVSLGKERWKNVTPEERSILMRGAVQKRNKNLSAEKLSEMASKAGRAYWDALSPEERSTEMKRRAKKRGKQRGANKEQV